MASSLVYQQMNNNFIGELLFVGLALIVVSILAWLVLRAMKSMYSGKFRAGKVEIISSVPIGTRERILIIRHRSHEYVLGVTAGGISLLDKYPAEENVSEENGADDVTVEENKSIE